MKSMINLSNSVMASGRSNFSFANAEQTDVPVKVEVKDQDEVELACSPDKDMEIDEENPVKRTKVNEASTVTTSSLETQRLV